MFLTTCTIDEIDAGVGDCAEETHDEWLVELVGWLVGWVGGRVGGNR